MQRMTLTVLYDIHMQVYIPMHVHTQAHSGIVSMQM
jgi:hypothetical protein